MRLTFDLDNTYVIEPRNCKFVRMTLRDALTYWRDYYISKGVTLHTRITKRTSLETKRNYITLVVIDKTLNGVYPADLDGGCDYTCPLYFMQESELI